MSDKPMAYAFKEYVWAIGLQSYVWRDQLEAELPNDEEREIKDLVPLFARPPATTCPGHGRPECATCCWPAAGYTAVDMSTAAADGYRDAVAHGFQRVAEVSVTNIDPHYPNPGRQVYVNWLWNKEDIPHGTLLYVRTDRSIGS